MFRSPSGQIVCVIATDLSKADTGGWVPATASHDGKPAAGAGVMCAGISNVDAAPDDMHGCPGGQLLRTSVIGVWNDGQGVGACSADSTKMFADARDHAEGGDRFALADLPYGKHAELGDYGCTVDGAQATCAQLSTGRGFTYEDSVGYRFFPAK